MTPERWQQLKALLHSALEREPAERAASLTEACGDDEALREELQSLLLHEEPASSFIEQPAFGVMAETLTNEQATTMLGRTLGRYRIIAALGSGGMGEVYVAEDTQLGRKIALKTLPAHFTIDDERVRRFQQEARAASALNHPNIITIYEIGQIDSRHFIVTELIEGETLRQRMAKTQMMISEALDVAAQVASALATAHQSGIVHRDIKPENIMLRADGIAKVLDFGLVKLTEPKNVTSDSPALFETAPGMVMGTAHYMSPEQARGLPVDARTDIWSLGIVLFEMVGGRVPFEGATSSDVIASILDREPTTLARYSPEAPTELEWIVKKALRKEREERCQTAKELLSDLKSLKRRLEFEQELERSMDSGPQSAGIAWRPGFVSSKDNREQRQSQEAQSHRVIDSLAIMPLTNASPDPNLEYLSDGITESIINSLSQLPHIRVMARSSAFRYKGKDISPQEVGRELAVRAVLTGRVLQVSDRLVVGTELVDTTDGTQLWGKHYNRNLSDIFEVQEEIAHEISEALRLRLTGKEQKRLAKRYTENTEAYQLYLKGLHFFNKRSVEGYQKAIEYYQQAIEIDPDYALAYAGLADCYANASLAEISPKDAIIKARTAAIKALEIDDTLAEAHNALAHVKVNLDWDWPGAEGEFRIALELNPNYAEAHHRYSHYLVAMGRFEESLTESFRCLELDPLDSTMNTHLGWHYLMARQEDRAIEQLKRALELDQSFINARLYLGRAYERKGMCWDAIAEIQKVRDFYGKRQIASGLLGYVYAVAGKRDEAEKTIEELKEQSKREYVWPYYIAIIWIGLGEKDQALEYLERACEDRSEELIYLKVEPMFDPLRSDPRFTDLVRRMGLLSVESIQPATLSSEKQSTETTRGQAASSEAYRAYLKGRYHWNRRIEEGFKKAIDYFNQAVEKDPAYAQAYAGLADCYALLSWYSVLPPKDSFPQAKAAALKALELDDTLAEAHTSLAFIKQSYDWDWSGADLEYKRALELNPGYATARQWYALFLSARGRHREALAEIEYAEELDPLSLVINRDGGWVSYWARQYDRAIAYYQKTFELEPHFYIAHYFLGEVYQQKGDFQKAIAEFHQTRTHPEWATKIWTLIAHARAHALKVERREAQQKIDELKSLSKQHYVSPYLIAVVYVDLAEQDQAFEWLEKAFEERDPYLTFLKVEPALDPLRSDPRFQDLMNRMGLHPGATSQPRTLSSAEQRQKKSKR